MLFCDNLEILYTLVESGYAFAVMPDFPSVRMPGLCYLPLPDFSPLSPLERSTPVNRSIPPCGSFCLCWNR